MTTHETLKKICDMIWCEVRYQIDWIWFYEELDIDTDNITSIKYRRYINEREIIFTPEFMEKLFEKVDETWVKIEILDHLHDPTSYIANILWIWHN
jgi:hypothetical protein